MRVSVHYAKQWYGEASVATYGQPMNNPDPRTMYGKAPTVVLNLRNGFKVEVPEEQSVEIDITEDQFEDLKAYAKALKGVSYRVI